MLRYAIHDIGRLSRVQDVASSARVGKCRNASAGKRVGPSGTKLGPAHLQWAFSEAATLCRRHHPNGQPLLTRVEKTPGTGKALSILAHTGARAVYDRLTRPPVGDLETCRHRSREQRG
jgi:transposase